VNKYIIYFLLTSGETITEEWDSEKDLKEFNKQIAQLVATMPLYTLLKDSTVINIFVSHIVNFNIKKNSE
jgi:hypothetical protein